ncbi:Hsp20/alpha crystallin family protein [Patescibacteria group bacterium]|nr:Hsp20/alpha crystallin family protein [Patescibacteria group bacterium]
MRWRPMWDMNDFEKFFEDMPMAPQKMASYTPAVDVYQDKNNVVVETPLAGVDPEKVNISVENDTLLIEGKSEHKSEVDEKNYYRKEVRQGSFYRAVALPAHIKADNAKATFENGMLKVVIPKVQEAKPKTIKVEVKKNLK